MEYKKRLTTRFLIFLFCIVLISGCASVPYTKPDSKVSAVLPPGIYHQVEKGETLWRISKVYGVDIDELVRVNQIEDSAAIEIGQKILIPNQFSRKNVYVKTFESDDFIWPVRGRIVGTYGQVIDNMINKGVNIAPYDSREILASRSGRVVFLGNNFAGLGKTIRIDHGDGFFTVYSLSSEILVKPGETVKQGTVIARVGFPGEGKKGYLHFQIRKGHLPQNPMFYLS